MHGRTVRGDSRRAGSTVDFGPQPCQYFYNFKNVDMKNSNSETMRHTPEPSAIPCFDHIAVARTKRKLAEDSDRLETLAKAYKQLGSPTRLKILLALSQGELCVCDIAHVLGLSMAATSHQLKMLRDQGWIRTRHDGKMVYYHLNSKELLQALKNGLGFLNARLAR